MKKISYYLVSMLVAAVLAVGCTEDITKDEAYDGPIGGPAKEMMEVTAMLESEEAPATDEAGESSRTTLDDNGNGGKIKWSDGDTIGAVSSDGTITECAATEINGNQAVFSVPTDTQYAYYPYQSSTFNAEAKTLSYTLADKVSLDGSNRVFDDGENVMVAHLSENKLDFYNLCGYIEIKLKGSHVVKNVALRSDANKWEAISGDGTIDLTEATNPTFTPSKPHGKTFHWINATCSNVQLSSDTATSFYMIVPPATYNHLNICVQTDKGSYSVTAKNAITVNRSKIRPLAAINLDSLAPTSATDLSEGGVANCYVVPQGSKAKYYSFPARKINADANLENIAYAHLMWSEDAQLINNVTYDPTTGMVSFKYAGNNAEGNACISVLNSSNATLWTWHIWCTDQPERIVIRSKNADKMYGILDRNLGATFTPKSVSEATSINATTGTDALGLHYQYGRPTPFPRAVTIQTNKDTELYSNKDNSYFGKNSRVGVQYGFRAYNQDFRYSTSARDYAEALSYPNMFYNIKFSDKDGTTTSSSGSWSSWCSSPYSNITEREYLWNSEDADIVTLKGVTDPCPAGYVVDEDTAMSNYLTGVAFKRVYWGAGATQAYGYYYECPVSGFLLYIPASGFRANGSAILSYQGQNFNLWGVPTDATEDSEGGVVGGRFSGNSSGTNDMTPVSRSFYKTASIGFNVRCRVMDRSELQNVIVIAAPFEGEGTAASPYVIKTSGDLVKLAGLCDGSLKTNGNEDFTTAHYILANSIDMLGVSFTPITPFAGSFDGQSNTLSNLKVSPKDDTPTGLFGEVTGATIKNLNITGGTVLVTSTSQLYTGGLAGRATDSTISDITFEGSVSSKASASFTETNTSYTGASSVTGGIVGFAKNSAISNVTFSGLVNTTVGQYVAGIVAALEGGSVTNGKFAKGSTITTKMNHVGGVAGFMCYDAEIRNCTVEGTLQSTNGYFGGVVGRMQSGVVSGCLVSSYSMVESFKDNQTTSYQGTGGIVGILQTISNDGTKAQIEKNACYADVFGNAYVGGIIGVVNCSSNTAIAVEIKECLFEGNISCAYKNTYNYGLSGGITGCCNQSASKGGQTTVTDCVALIDGFTFNATAATSAGYGGLTGYTKTTDYVRCYTNLDLGTMVSQDGTPIGETTLKYYGALHGRTSGASNANNFTNVYYLTGQEKGQEAATSETNVETLSTTQMTDGTLLGKLNGAGGSWVANATGYPVPTTVPANTGVSSSVAKTRVSIIGDSISTFEGWMPSGYAKFYPIANNPTVISAAQTYWYKLIYKYMSNAMLEKNIAWSGTVVARSTDETYLSTDHGAGHCFVERFRDDGMGDPDVILLHGGTNDVGNRGVSIAVHPNYPTYGGTGYTKDMCPTDEELAAVFSTVDAATTWDQLLALNDTSFVEAYTKLLSMMHFKHPNAKVVMIIGDWIHAGTRQAILKIASHYGTKYGYKCVDLQDISPYGTYNVIPKESGCHPNEAGFEVMANYIYEQAGSYID